MPNFDVSNHDQVTNPLAPPDGLPSDAAPPDDAPPDANADQPAEDSSHASGPPAADPESTDPQSSDPQSSDTLDSDPSGSVGPSKKAPAPKTKKLRGKRPNHADREHKLLKSDRSGIGGPKTAAGKAISSLNNLQHGLYSRLPFFLLPDESREQYDALSTRLRNQYPPIDESSEQMLELHIQAYWRLGRCNRAEFLAETADQTDLSKYLRGIFGVSSHRSRCERSYYLSLETLKQLFADYQQQQDDIRELAQAQEMEQLEEAAKPVPRFNAEGEEMREDFPRIQIHKLSCDPDSRSNEVFEFDCTKKGKYSVKRTPLRDWEGGWMLDPSVKPRGMKGEWPDHLLGPYKKQS